MNTVLLSMRFFYPPSSSDTASRPNLHGYTSLVLIRRTPPVRLMARILAAPVMFPVPLSSFDCTSNVELANMAAWRHSNPVKKSLHSVAAVPPPEAAHRFQL